jgi:ATP-dependent Lon protease
MKGKKRGGPKDDSDVDDNGNVPDLIDYNYDSEEEETDDDSMTSSERKALKKKGKLPASVKKGLGSKLPRKAAVKAGRRIKKIQSRRSDTSDSTYVPKKKAKSKKVESEESEGETLGSEDTEDEDEEEYDDEDEEDEEYDDYYDEEVDPAQYGFSISIGNAAEPTNRQVPSRHKMKKESESVQKFVKLVTAPTEVDTIDDQIDQFKELSTEKQGVLLTALEKRSEYVKKEQPLMFRLLQMNLKPEMMAMVMARYNAMNQMDPASGEYYKLRSWMEKLVSIPLGMYKDMPVTLDSDCSPFMTKARSYLEDAIYGQEEAKLQIMQFIASKIANPTSSGLSLLLVGPPGIGKTSLIKNGIAKALEWPFQFISLGGDSDSSTYTGHQFVYEGSHCGKIANCLAQAKSMSMILMFDELDKVSATPKGEEIQNLLVHLTDPVQNMEFEDKYLTGIPLDMSRAMLVFSGNDMSKIDRILLDRMVVVTLSGYQKKDKIVIADKYLLPAALKEVNLNEKVSIPPAIVEYIIENFASDEPGVRELKRCIEQIVQRINMLRMFNVKELPFHIAGFSLPFVLKKEHVDLFLKKKDLAAKTPFGMYT